MKKIAFFDIDGTLTSEIDGSLPKSAINAIRHARTFGHLMFINTGRCFQNVEPRFREFDTLKSKKVPQSLEIGLFFCQIFIFII